MCCTISFLAASDAVLPIRIVASIALVAVIIAFIYVPSHLRKIEQTIVSDNVTAPVAAVYDRRRFRVIHPVAAALCRRVPRKTGATSVLLFNFHFFLALPARF